MKNLIVCICGDQSMHKIWTDKNPNFDLFVVYYGETEGKFANHGKYYTTSKGTKFVILADVVERYEEVFASYDNICIPDDDLYITAYDWNRFFAIFNAYMLSIAQPSIMGWQCMMTSAHNPNYILRYTNWVEIMTPCFSQETFQKCRKTFRENRTNWGIDYMWPKLLGYPEDKIAIVDDVVAIHTRPCFFGDTYWRNKNSAESAYEEIKDLSKKYEIDLEDIVEYGGIKRKRRDYDDRPSEDKFFPNNCEIMKELIATLREKRNRAFI